jgi:hypothetical protein
MPALPKNVVGAVDRKKVKVYFADRTMTKFWNERRNRDDLRFFGGWYWYIETNGRAEETENGPYKTESAAYRDAFLSLSLRRLRDEELTTQIRGTGVVKAPQAATQSEASQKKAEPKTSPRASVGRKLAAANAASKGGRDKSAPRRGRKRATTLRSLAESRS